MSPASQEDANILAFAEILYHGDKKALADLRTALADFIPFYRQHGAAMLIDVDYLVNHMWADGADPWGVLIDVGTLHKFVHESDWRAGADEIAEGLAELVTARKLKVDWDEVAEMEAEAAEIYTAIATQVRPAGDALIICDRGSDSYPLAFVPAKSTAEAQRLALAIGRGEVFVPDE